MVMEVQLTDTAVRARPLFPPPPLNLPLVCSSRWFGTGQVGTAPLEGCGSGEGGSSHTDSRSLRREAEKVRVHHPPDIFPPKDEEPAKRLSPGGCSCLGQLFVLPCASSYLDLITDPRIPHLQLKYFCICTGSDFIHSQNHFRSGPDFQSKLSHVMTNPLVSNVLYINTK